MFNLCVSLFLAGQLNKQLHKANWWAVASAFVAVSQVHIIFFVYAWSAPARSKLVYIDIQYV
jgi:hypothetical protein